MYELEVRVHEPSGILCRSDGMVFNPSSKTKGWTKGRLALNGYLVTTRNYKKFYVHRLIAEAFLPNPDNKPSVDHRNRDREDNSISNLQWANWGEQSRNTLQYDRAFEKYGVHYCDDANEYKRRWAEAHKESRRESQRRYAEKKKAKNASRDVESTAGVSV